MSLWMRYGSFSEKKKKKKREKESRPFELHPIYLTKCPVLWNTDVSCQGNPALTHNGNAVPSGGVTCGNLKDESWPMTTILKVCTLPGKKRTLAVSPYIHIHQGPHSTPTSTKANPQEICRSSGAENNDDNDSSAPTRASAEAMHSVRLLIWDAIQQLYKFTVKVAPKNNSEFKNCSLKGRTACLILKRLWPRNSWLCLLGNWTMVRVQGIEANEYYNELAIFNPSDSQAQRARKSQLYRKDEESTTWEWIKKPL